MPICAECGIGVGMDLFCPKCYYKLEKVVEAARKIEEMPCEAQIIDELWDAIKALDELDGRSG